MSDGEPIALAACDECEWTLTRDEVEQRIRDGPFHVTDERIRRKFGSLREGHAYFNRGHAPYYIRGEDDE